MAVKKSFAGQMNPALKTPAAAFISAAEPEAAPAQPTPSSAVDVTAPAPDGYMINPIYIEKKTRRLQLLIKPSLYNAVKAKADAEGQSVNECINAILEAATKAK